MHMAHKDPKIKAIVAQVPMIDPVLTLNVSEYERGIEKTEALQGQIVQWLKKRWFTNKPEMLLAVRRHDDDVALLATEELLLRLVLPLWCCGVLPKCGCRNSGRVQTLLRFTIHLHALALYVH